MHRYIAGIEVTSQALTLHDVSAALGLTPTSGGSRGDPGAGGRLWDCTVWRFGPALPDDASLDDHLAAAFAACPGAEALANLRSADPAAELRLRVAAIHSTFTCTVAIPVAWVRRAADAGFEIEISTYPGDGT